MSFKVARLLVLIAPVALGGCCSLVPCHPATYITGTVRDAVSKQVIPGAEVRLYSFETLSGSSGCFALGGADGPPFEFAVSAPGYEPLVIEADPGFFVATVALTPKGGGTESTAKFEAIQRERYTELARDCS